MKPLITNIQRFCVHDGPGIRTTVFFKGCSLHCPWCANPENIKPEEEFYYIKEKCNDNCKFTSICKSRQDKAAVETDLQNCVYGAIGRVGAFYTAEQLYSEIIKDKKYYGSEGGVTFSGGEPLLFLREYSDLLEKLHKENINIAVETALMMPETEVLWAVKYIDYFYMDIKLLIPNKCKEILGGNTELFVQNLEHIHKKVASDRLVYRIPIVPDITDTPENLHEIQQLILKYPPEHMEIFSVHNLGEKKYQRLGKFYEKFDAVSKEKLNDIKAYFENLGINCKINSL